MSSFSKLVGFLASLTGALAGGVYIGDHFFGERPINSVDDVVAKLELIADRIGTGGLPLNDSDVSQITLALADIASNSASALPDGPSAADGYLRVYSGSFVLNEGTALDLEAPDGTYNTIGFQDFVFANTSEIFVTFDGETSRNIAGESIAFTYEGGSCGILYLGQGDGARNSARFRLRCA